MKHNIKITKIIKNKDTILKNIEPNVIKNRFDLLYGDDFDLYLVNNFYIPVKIFKKEAHIGLYLRKMDKNDFKFFIKYLFKNYKKLKTIDISHTYTEIDNVEEKPHWHLELPTNIEDFNKTLEKKVRYNYANGWYDKKIKNELNDGQDYKIEHYFVNQISKEMMEFYFKFKNITHNYVYNPNVDYLYYLKEYGITDCLVMYIKNEISAILLYAITDDNIYFDNFTYNIEYKKYSLGTVIYYNFIKRMIEEKKKNIYILGGELEYKKRFNGIRTDTRTINIKRITMLTKFSTYINNLPFEYKIRKRISKIFSIFIFKKNKRKNFKNSIIDNDEEKILNSHKNVKFDIVKRAKEMGFASNDYSDHTISNTAFINILLSNIKIDKNWNFLDAGSGTGYVIWKMSNKFKKVYGIELSEELVNISNKNLKELKVNNYNIINKNINEITSENIKDINIFYFYNPFNGETMENFINTISNSFKINDREAYLVYINDVSKDIFEKFKGSFILYKLIEDQNWRNSRIYYHKKGFNNV